MKDFLDNSANVTLLFGIVKRSELDCTLSSSDMRLEDRGLTLSLGLQHVVGAVEEPTKRVKANRKDSWVSDDSLRLLRYPRVSRWDLLGRIYPW